MSDFETGEQIKDDAPTDSEPLRRLSTWLAERDSGLAGAVEQIEAARPDKLATSADQVQFLAEIVDNTARRELIREILDEIASGGYTKETEQP